jgi:hypothetical protein
VRQCLDTFHEGELNGLYSSSVGWLASQQERAEGYGNTCDEPLYSTEWGDDPLCAGLVRSFAIPQDDPDYGYHAGDGTHRVGSRLERRSFVYDDALAVLAFLSANRGERAHAILTQLANLQSDDGSLPFSVDSHLGHVADDYRRTGALAWVGYAAVRYEFEIGTDEFRPFAERLANYLQTLQVTRSNGFLTDDPRSGSVLAGRGRYDSAYNFFDTPMTFASTEHNIGAYFFLRDLAYLTGDVQHREAVHLIKHSLLAHHWDAADQRFYEGISLVGPEAGRALDLSSWGGLFLLAVGETDGARAVARTLSDFHVCAVSVGLSSDMDSFNQTFSSPGPFDGYKPYAPSPGYDTPPELIWAEGTWGALLLRLRLGEDISSDLTSMQRLQAVDPQGGFVQGTAGRRGVPYEFHVWPAVGGTAWAAIVTGDPTMLWAADGWSDRPRDRDRRVAGDPGSPDPAQPG